MRCYQCRRMLGKHGAYYHAGYPFCYQHWLWRSGNKPKPDRFMWHGMVQCSGYSVIAIGMI